VPSQGVALSKQTLCEVADLRSRLLGSVYQVLDGTRQWPGLLTLLVDSVRAERAAIYSLRYQGSLLEIASINTHEVDGDFRVQVESLLRRFGPDPGVRLHAGPTGFYLCATLGDFVIAFQGAGEKGFDDAEVELLRSLLPALQRVTRVIGELWKSRAMLCVLDRLRFGVLLVNPSGRVLHQTAKAKQLLELGHGLSLMGGQVSTAIRAQEAGFQRLLKQVAESTEGSAHARQVVRLNGISEESFPVTVFRCVCPAGEDATSCIALLLGEARDRVAIDLEMVRTLYGLTVSEARVAESVLQGKGLKHGAATLSIAPSTARTHLRKVFEKVQVTGQSAMVLELLRIPGG
jgi:DNA-binding CsgD family transcriptional regulator